MTKRLRINPEPKGGSIYLSRGGSILFSGIVTLTFQPKLKNIAGTQIADLCAYPCARYILAPQKPNTPYEVIRHKIYNSEVVNGLGNCVSMKTKTGAPRAFSGGACRSRHSRSTNRIHSKHRIVKPTRSNFGSQSISSRLGDLAEDLAASLSAWAPHSWDRAGKRRHFSRPPFC